MAIVIFFAAHWFLSLFCQTFFHHRYAAHRMFSMSRFWERFFHLSTFVLQGASYLNPRAYAILHRMHHAYSDTEKDPHSPHWFSNLFALMWNTKLVYKKLHTEFPNDAAIPVDGPVWESIDRYGDKWAVRILYGTLYTCFYFAFAPSLWWCVLLPAHYLMGPIHGAIVNWCGHKYGYRNFDTRDKSRNTLIVDFLMMGELYQNNHHKFPNRMNFAYRWFELDPGYLISKLLFWSGIIQHVRPVPVSAAVQVPASTD